MYKIFLGGLVAALATVPATAQDGVASGGFHVEAIGGYEGFEGDGGAVYGAGLGYDFNAGGVLLGIDGEITDSTTEECLTSALVAGDELCAQAGRDLYVGGRVGAPVGRNALVYAGLGYVNGRVNIQYTDPAGLVDEDGVSVDGFRAKGGVELGLGGNAFARAEYRYSQFDGDFDKHQVVGGIGFRF